MCHSEGELEPQRTHTAGYVIEPNVRNDNMTDGIVESRQNVFYESVVKRSERTKINEINELFEKQRFVDKQLKEGNLAGV